MALSSLGALVLVPTAVFNLSDVSWRNESDSIAHFYGDSRISPWHDVPFSLGVDYHGNLLLSFICEIPRHTRAKFEIHKGRPYTPLLQDVHKDGSLRFYAYSESCVNYGAIAQTWEDPSVADTDTGLGGDNDPIDVLQLNDAACERGAVQRVRVLGALPLVDEDQTDWKLLVVDVDAPDAPAWMGVADVPTARVDEVRAWFRVYKTAEGKPENRYSLDGRAVGARHAMAVANGTHEQWVRLRRGQTEGCRFKKHDCWLGAHAEGVARRDEL